MNDSELFRLDRWHTKKYLLRSFTCKTIDRKDREFHQQLFDSHLNIFIERALFKFIECRYVATATTTTTIFFLRQEFRKSIKKVTLKTRGKKLVCVAIIIVNWRDMNDDGRHSGVCRKDLVHDNFSLCSHNRECTVITQQYMQFKYKVWFSFGEESSTCECMHTGR